MPNGQLKIPEEALSSICTMVSAGCSRDDCAGGRVRGTFSPGAAQDSAVGQRTEAGVLGQRLICGLPRDTQPCDVAKGNRGHMDGWLKRN